MNLRDLVPSVAALAPQAISLDVLREKYCKDNETSIEDVNARVANALADVESERRDQHREAFLWALQQGFLPAGRIQSAAGTPLAATLINCFVQPVGDSIAQVDDGYPGIYTALTEAAETMRRGGGVGYDFSRIRPRGAWVGSTRSHASGPVSYMQIFDRSCETVESAGARRGAQMGVLRCDHPDIEEFIHAKDDGGLKNFNLSVAVTDAFMQAVLADGEVDLVHRAEPGEAQKASGARLREGSERAWIYRTVKARDLWDQIMRSTYDHAEPGVLFIDTINRDNNLSYCETIESCNPCSEQSLPAYGCCCLGSIDLTRFVLDPFGPAARFDDQRFTQVARVAVRMLDNVLDTTVWPLAQQQQQATDKRRVGLGFTGLGDALVMLGLAYSTPEARSEARRIAELMRDAAYAASVELARERGAFPAFDADLYLSRGTFASRLPTHLREQIRQHGIRNSHLLTVAPTGSTGTMAGVSTGLEPYFSFTYYRSGRLGKFIEVKADIVQEYLDRHPDADPMNLPDYFVAAMTLAPEEHVDVQTTIQRWVDSSISKTVNAPKGYTVDQVEKIYERLYLGGAKGGTVYVDGSRDSQVLTLKAEENVWDEEGKLEEEKEHVKINKDKTFLVDSIANLEATDVTIGNEIGDTCPICRQGTVEDLGGCNTCTNCGAQLKCGL